MKDCTNKLNQSHFMAPVGCVKADKGVIPANNRANSNWAVKNFREWASNCSAVIPYDPVPSNLLECRDPQ